METASPQASQRLPGTVRGANGLGRESVFAMSGFYASGRVFGQSNYERFSKFGFFWHIGAGFGQGDDITGIDFHVDQVAARDRQRHP